MSGTFEQPDRESKDEAHISPNDKASPAPSASSGRASRTPPKVDILCDEAGIAGVKYLHSRHPAWFRVVWFALLVTCLVLMITQLNRRITDYISNPVTVDFAVEYPDGIRLPNVVVCQRNPFKITNLADSGLEDLIVPLNLTYSADNPSKENISDMKNYTKSLSFNQLLRKGGSSLTDTVLSCQWSENPNTNCISQFYRQLTVHGECFVLNSSEWIARSNGLDGSITLLLHDPGYARLPGLGQRGFMLGLFDKDEVPLMTQGFQILPGSLVYMPMRPRRTNYHETVCSIAELHFVEKHYTKYSRSGCILRNFLANIRRKCGCMPFGFPEIASPTCTVVEQISCISPNLQNRELYDIRSCKPSCITTAYNPQPTFAPLIEDEVNDALGTEWRLKITEEIMRSQILIDEYFNAKPASKPLWLYLNDLHLTMMDHYAARLSNFLSAHGDAYTQHHWDKTDFTNRSVCNLAAGSSSMSMPYWIQSGKLILLKMLQIKNAAALTAKIAASKVITDLFNAKSNQDILCPISITEQQCVIETTGKSNLKQILNGIESECVIPQAGRCRDLLATLQSICGVYLYINQRLQFLKVYKTGIETLEQDENKWQLRSGTDKTSLEQIKRKKGSDERTARFVKDIYSAWSEHWLVQKNTIADETKYALTSLAESPASIIDLATNNEFPWWFNSQKLTDLSNCATAWLDNMTTIFDMDKSVAKDYQPTFIDIRWLQHLDELHSLSVKQLEMETGGSESVKQNVAQVKIYFSETSMEVITQRQTMDIWVLFADVGGTMGLYLGASAMAIMEMFVILFRKNKIST